MRAFTVLNIHFQCAPAKFPYLSLVALIRVAYLGGRGTPACGHPVCARSEPIRALEPLTPGEYAEPGTGTYLNAFAIMEAVDPGTLSASAGLVGDRGPASLRAFTSIDLPLARAETATAEVNSRLQDVAPTLVLPAFARGAHAARAAHELVNAIIHEHAAGFG